MRPGRGRGRRAARHVAGTQRPGEADISSTTASGPLEGCTVLVTRAKHQAAGLAGPLEALGATVLVAPVIDTVEPADWELVDAAIDRLSSYDWVVLTSVNAVDRFTARMQERGLQPQSLASVKVAVVGPSTAERLHELGVSADLVPDDYRAEGLVREFAALGAGPEWRVLVPRAEQAREILPDSLRTSGAHVDVVPVYRTVPAAPDPAIVDTLRRGEVDVITFTSPSTVRHFLAWVESAGLSAAEVMASAASASIGPVTSEALESRGYTVACEATDSTATGLVDAIRLSRAAGSC